MKNKRNKLTAILLSAMMALSTISSVTWAADLFSDGSEETEVMAEKSEDVLSEIEDEIVADDSSLTGLSKEDITKVVFGYDTDTTKPNKVTVKVYYKDDKGTENYYTLKDEFITQATDLGQVNGRSAILDATCSSPKRAVYSAQIDGITVYSTDAISQVETVCTKWWNGSTFVLANDVPSKYIVVPGDTPLGGTVGHEQLRVEKEYVITSPTCIEQGVKIVYYGCKWCDAIVDEDNNEVLASGWKRENVLTLLGGWNSLASGSDPSIPGNWKEDTDKDSKVDFNELAKKEFNNNESSTKDLGRDLWLSAVDKIDHVYDESNPITLDDSYYKFGYDKNGDGRPDDNVLYSRETQSFVYDDYKNYVANGIALDITSKNTYTAENGGSMLQFAPLNCIGTQIADPENGRDAYYYIVVRCKYCNTVKYHGNVILNDVSNEVVGDCYEKVDEGNVIGFFDKGNKNKIYLFNSFIEKDSKGIELNASDWETKLQNNGFTVEKLKKIPKDKVSDSPEPVFARCGKIGYYYTEYPNALPGP